MTRIFAMQGRSISRAAIPRRRLMFAGWTIAAVSLLVVACHWMDSNLLHSAWLSGHVLAASVIFLAAFRVRKFFPSVSWFGSASGWMQLHAWTGIAAMVIFGTHLSWQVPNGMFERLLATSFLLTGFSGIYGLIATRLIPRKLANIPRQVVYEQIPAFRHELAIRANQIVAACPGTTLARYYVNHVAAFMQLPRPVAFVVAPSARGCRKVLAGIRSLDRYLTEEERTTSRDLMQIVREKDDLDYHRAMQGRLKWWLVIHLTLTGNLLIIGTLHTVMVYAFSGGGP